VEALLDTNVVLHQIDATDPAKHRVANRLIEQALLDGRTGISFQVMQECINGVLRKAHSRLDAAAADRWLSLVLEPLCVVFPTTSLYHRAIALHQRWQLAFYDALIVAAALEAGCKRLLSEDLRHGLKIEGLRVENPFRGA
jgi:predicted nucleic acid-binding protein